MIRKFHVQNFRMLRSCSFDLSHALLLTGSAACGKSSVLAAIQFVSDIVGSSASAAARALAPSLMDLAFDPSRPIAFAVELVPSSGSGSCTRYELELCHDDQRVARISREHLFVVANVSMLDEPPPMQQALFEPDPTEHSLIHDRTPRGWRRVVAKSTESRDYFWDERSDWHNMLRFGADRSALGCLPEDAGRFPTALGARDFLRERVSTIAFEIAALRRSAPPGSHARLHSDGSNLPCAVRALKESSPDKFARWQEALRLAVPGFAEASVRERESDRHLVLEAKFDGSRETPVPSWCLSDSLLRLMALTLLPNQLSGTDEMVLIDEPETALHPRGVHLAYELLKSIDLPAQILCATASSLLTGRAEREEVIVLRRGDDGGCEVLVGDDLPPKTSWLEA